VSDDELAEIFESYPSLEPINRFTGLIPKTPWFRNVADPIDSQLMADSRHYAEALGFPEAEPAVLTRWEDAAGALETTDLNPPAWEAEEQLRASLTDQASALVDQPALEKVLNYVAAVAADSAQRGAEDVQSFLQIEDENFVQLATGAAAQVCHQAALVLAADAGAEHPFSLKYHLFEHGRWPLSIIGNSLNIF